MYKYGKVLNVIIKVNAHYWRATGSVELFMHWAMPELNYHCRLISSINNKLI